MLLKKLCELGTIASSKYIINERLLISLPPLMSPNLLVWSLRLNSGWCMVAHLVTVTVIFNKFNIFVNWSFGQFHVWKSSTHAGHINQNYFVQCCFKTWSCQQSLERSTELQIPTPPDQKYAKQMQSK